MADEKMKVDGERKPLSEAQIQTLEREFDEIYRKGGLPALREATQGCPACIVATHMQDVLARGERLSDPDEWLDFDYKGAVSEFMSRHQSAVWP